jgi:predicted nucleic acid-binding protein
VKLLQELARINSVFLDTAPIIYYIEAHPEFGPIAKEVVTAFQSGNLAAYSSVITLTEVLSKPIESGDEKLAKKFAEFLKHGKQITLVEISEGIAEAAANLRGRHPSLKTVDAVQIATALNIGADAFITNDTKLKQVTDIKVFVLKDYLEK